MENTKNVGLHKILEEILIDFGKVCRFCLNRTESGIPLNEKCLYGESSELEKNTILDFVSKSGFIRMGDLKWYPSKVCENCYNAIKLCNSFSQMCQKSDDLLRSYFENHVKEIQGMLSRLENNTDNNIFIKDHSSEASLLDFTLQMKPGENLKQSVTSLEIYKKKLNSLSGRIKEVQSKFTSSPLLKDNQHNHVCTLCLLNFSNSRALNLHYFTTHKLKKFKYQCKHCNKSFNEQEKLKNHYKLIHSISDAKFPYECLKKVKHKTCICFYCGSYKKFQSKDQLVKHFEEWHKIGTLENVSKTYTCAFCSDSRFATKLNLNEHLLLVHNLKEDEKFFAKQESSEMFVNNSPSQNLTDLSDFLNVLDSVVDSLSVVQQEKGSGFKVFCKNCTLMPEFTSQHDFLNHVQTHHDPSKLLISETKKCGPWNCFECPASYTKKQSLYYHMREKHKYTNLGLVKCPEPNCLQSFTTNRQLIRHGISVHQKYFAYFHKVFKKVLYPTKEERDSRIKDFECDICQKKYIYKTSLRKHILTSHLGRSVKNNVFCSYCGKTLSSQLNLKSHIEFVHEALFVSCPICKKKINFRTIGKHYKTHRNSDMVYSKNSILCNLCGKILKSKRSFEDHQKLHKNIRNELCDICGSGFTTKKILRLHKKTHEGLERKVFGCNQCDKVYSGRHTLKRHLLTHSGKKNFICEICSKCFYTLQELNRHVRYHKKEYRFDCQLCDMRFLDKSRFRHHMMRHRNVRPHKCHLCGKMFIVKGKMNLHLAAKHNVEVQNSKGIWKDPKTYIPLDDLL